MTDKKTDKNTEDTCTSCRQDKGSVRDRTIKENGVLGYYDVNVKWCDECVSSHNYYLLASWGQE